MLGILKDFLHVQVARVSFVLQMAALLAQFMITDDLISQVNWKV